jgi:hypothetical protein
VILACAALNGAQAQSVRVGPDMKSERNTLAVPYPFYNDSFGVAAGYVYAKTGNRDKPHDFITTGAVGSKGSAMVFFAGRNYRLPISKRLFLDPIASVGYFRDNDAYIDGNPDFPDERAGSNGSDQDDFVTGDGWDNFVRMNIKYLLPIGTARDEIVHTYVVQNGLLVSGASGGDRWNPWTSGRTFLQLRPFYRSQEIDGDDVDSETKTNGLEYSIFYDNRDFIDNPARGSALRLKLNQDYGLFDSSNSWTVVDLEFDKYFDLGATETFRQRVLAFDFWTAYSPSWETRQTPQGEVIENRPPSYAGATLGGLWRMRGFPAQRFSDKAAVYYAAEYRMIPKWNPLTEIDWLQSYLGMSWWQFVPFVEVGRVAPDWSVSKLHSSMKWNVGLGLRAMVQGIVIRIDGAGSDESFEVAMMISQPFQF